MNDDGLGYRSGSSWGCWWTRWRLRPPRSAWVTLSRLLTSRCGANVVSDSSSLVSHGTRTLVRCWCWFAVVVFQLDKLSYLAPGWSGGVCCFRGARGMLRSTLVRRTDQHLFHKQVRLSSLSRPHEHLKVHSCNYAVSGRPTSLAISGEMG